MGADRSPAALARAGRLGAVVRGERDPRRARWRAAESRLGRLERVGSRVGAAQHGAPARDRHTARHDIPVRFRERHPAGYRSGVPAGCRARDLRAPDRRARPDDPHLLRRARQVRQPDLTRWTSHAGVGAAPRRPQHRRSLLGGAARARALRHAPRPRDGQSADQPRAEPHAQRRPSARRAGVASGRTCAPGPGVRHHRGRPHPDRRGHPRDRGWRGRRVPALALHRCLALRAEHRDPRRSGNRDRLLALHRRALSRRARARHDH